MTAIPPGEPAATSPQRRIFCNRTLNLRSIDAIGYDMDYTLIHYVVEEWERHAFEHVKARLGERGWPVAELIFDHSFIRGLIIDIDLGNIVKANRFGYVKVGYHGTRLIPFNELRDTYSRTIVDLAEKRWQFMNTFFSLSEACLYAQLVDLLDRRAIPEVMGYDELYVALTSALNYAHVEGRLKAEVIADPDRFVELDAEAPLALLDQKYAGKKLLLVTNSDWQYTRAMMEYAFDRFLPADMTWRQLFDVIIVSARKPLFFTGQNALFHVASEDGLLRPVADGLRDDGVYLGGSVDHVESYLGVSGDRILFVGDHIFGDVHVSKKVQRWRTGLVMRELEGEIAASEGFRTHQAELAAQMAAKEALESEYCQIKLALQRRRRGYGPRLERPDGPAGRSAELDAGASRWFAPDGPAGRSAERDAGASRWFDRSVAELTAALDELRGRILALDDQIAPLARASAELGNQRWGLLMRAGNDKSHLARQIERHADIYTSRVSNFLHQTPFKYFRSTRGSLPHDADR